MKVVSDKEEFLGLSNLLADTVGEAVLYCFPPNYEGENYPATLEQGGLYLEDSDPEKIIYIEMPMPVSFFGSSEIEQYTRMGINWERLSGYISKGKTDEVLLDLDNQTRKLQFSDGKKVSGDMALIDPDSISSADTPSFQFDVTFSCEVGDLHDAVDTAEMISDGAIIRVEEHDGGYRAIAEGSGDTDDIQQEICRFGEEAFHRDTPEEMSSKFGINFIKKITRNIPNDAAIDISMLYEHEGSVGKNFPLGASVQVGDVPIQLYVAPRMKSSS